MTIPMKRGIELRLKKKYYVQTSSLKKEILQNFKRFILRKNRRQRIQGQTDLNQLTDEVHNAH